MKGIDSESSATYIHVTHQLPENIKNTSPNEIGISLTPFPYSLLRTDYSRIPADSLPRCLKCGAFINKYDICEGYVFKCPFCNFSTQSRIPFDIDGAEFTSEVYEAYCTKYPVHREQFTPTDFFFISISLLKTCPNLLDIIEESFIMCTCTKQVGIAFIHGGITVVKFRENMSFQTYPCEVPVIRYPTIFILVDKFRKSLPLIKSKAQELVDIPQLENNSESKVPNFIKFATQCLSVFGTSGKFFLDEKDFHSVYACHDIRNDALHLCRFGSQVSIFPIFNSNSNYSSVAYKSPLFDLCSITGGFLKFFNIDDTNQETKTNSLLNLKQQLIPYLKYKIYHDTVLYIIPPIDCQVTDFAGNGFLQSHNVVSVPKIKKGDTFFFKVDARTIKRPFFQFVVYFTNEVGVKKLRIFTIKFGNFPREDLYALSSFLAAITAQRLLVEESADLKKFVEELKKKYADFQKILPVCAKAEILASTNNCAELYERALACRSFQSLQEPIISKESGSDMKNEIDL